jgi:hypothetical protein
MTSTQRNEKMFREMRRAIKAGCGKAVRVALQEFIRQVEPMVPVYSGTLRNSMRVRASGKNMSVVIGNAKTEKYLAVQYYKPLRHMGSLKEGFLSLKAIPAPKATRGRRSPAALYAARYRAALKAGLMKKSPAPTPFERGVSNNQIMDTVYEVFVNALEVEEW